MTTLWTLFIACNNSSPGLEEERDAVPIIAGTWLAGDTSEAYSLLHLDEDQSFSFEIENEDADGTYGAGCWVLERRVGTWDATVDLISFQTTQHRIEASGCDDPGDDALVDLDPSLVDMPYAFDGDTLSVAGVNYVRVDGPNP